jgi:hypothetical protein
MFSLIILSVNNFSLINLIDSAYLFLLIVSIATIMHSSYLFMSSIVYICYLTSGTISHYHISYSEMSH